MRRTGILFVAFLLLVPVAGASAAHRADSTLQDKLAKALHVPHVSTASSGAIAVDLSSGEQLFALNDTLPLAPASNEKLALTYALLSAFNPRMRIATTVKGLGVQRGTTLARRPLPRRRRRPAAREQRPRIARPARSRRGDHGT